MAKHADGPKSGRTGFGFREHQKAGVAYLVRDNKAVVAINDKPAEKALRELVSRHPDQAEQVRSELKKGWSAFDVLASLQLRLGKFKL